MKSGVQLVILCSLTLSACEFNAGEKVNGNGHLKSEVRHINSTDRIKVEGDMDVIIDSGSASVRVEADDNLLPYIITDEDNGWIEIKTKDDVNINSTNHIKVYLTTPKITAIRVAGSGDISTAQKFYSNNKMTFDIAGSGNISINANAPQIEAHIAGSGDVRIAGETKDLDIDLAGSGNYEGDGLKSENAKVNIAGSGDATLFADASLNAKIMGSGSVKYKGNAKVDKTILGSGSVSKIE